MKCTNYYLITPRPELTAVCSKLEDRELAELLLERPLISIETGSHKLNDPGDHARIKIIYFASIRELDPLNTDEEAIRILGSSAMTAEMFDRWWTLERLHYESAEFLESDLSGMLARFEDTGFEAVDRLASAASGRCRLVGVPPGARLAVQAPIRPPPPTPLLLSLQRQRTGPPP